MTNIVFAFIATFSYSVATRILGLPAWIAAASDRGYWIW